MAARGTRHATRTLVVRSSPDDTSTVVASIGAATSVTVTGAVGRWRYVRNAKGDEGWVDGTYLAGEASAPAPATDFRLLQTVSQPLDAKLSPMKLQPRPVPPLGIGGTRDSEKESR